MARFATLRKAQKVETDLKICPLSALRDLDENKLPI